MASSAPSSVSRKARRWRRSSCCKGSSHLCQRNRLSACFQIAMNLLRAANEADRCQTISPAIHRLLRRGDDPRMIGQSQIIIRAQIQDRSIRRNRNPRVLRGKNRPLAASTIRDSISRRVAAEGVAGNLLRTLSVLHKAIQIIQVLRTEQLAYVLIAASHAPMDIFRCAVICRVLAALATFRRLPVYECRPAFAAGEDTPVAAGAGDQTQSQEYDGDQQQKHFLKPARKICWENFRRMFRMGWN